MYHRRSKRKWEKGRKYSWRYNSQTLSKFDKRPKSTHSSNSRISRRINTVVFTTTTFTIRHIIIKLSEAKCKKNIESRKRRAAFFIKVNLNNVNRCFLRNHGGKKAMVWHIQSAERKRLQTMYFISSKNILLSGEIKTISDELKTKF